MPQTNPKGTIKTGCVTAALRTELNKLLAFLTLSNML